tara:strand:- start:92 stop:277 length:186 start_codon:yes stop_codon:yes gene_type:complete
VIQLSQEKDMNLLAIAGLIWAFLLAIGFEMKGGTLIILVFLVIAGLVEGAREVGGFINVLL